MRGRLRVGLGLALLIGVVAAPLPGRAQEVAPAYQAEGPHVVVTSLSNRADLVSGGDALVEVALPAGARPQDVLVDVAGRDVTAAFAVRGDGRYVGLVEGLALGPNVVTATLRDGRGARLTVTNHPIGGPVFSGPQIQPWTCVGESDDAQCNRAPSYTFLYKPSGGGALRAYDPENPPTDVAMTTTDEGVTVPFIVRQERGVIDRDNYSIAVLFDPAQPWEPGEPQEQFNSKLVINHGASCDTEYQMAGAPAVLREQALGLGFAVMAHAMNNSGHNCNLVTQAEAMVMTKERIVERYGELRYTIGSGCSGGALAQQWVANAYPGLYQGITPACSFTDAWSSGLQYFDYQLLRAYFENPTRWAPGVAWEPVAISEANGHPNPANPVTFTEVIPSKEASRVCPGVPAADVYHPQTNPEGVRCTLQDWWVNVFGTDPATGFARKPTGNSGIQYALNGLLEGLVSPAQFVDLNEKIGGQDIDGVPSAERFAADPLAAQRVYRSGGNNTASNMDEVAIIDLRGPDPGAFHDVYRTYVMRDRLIREHGTAANQVLWRGQQAIQGDATFNDAAVLAMDEWLAAVEADTRDVPLARRIIENRPSDLTDRCTDGRGADIASEVCDATVESYSSPRISAGMPETDDVTSCQLQPLDRDAYQDVVFTDAEWARMVAAFPDGVCDWTKPSIGDQDTVPWLDYSDGPGGRPLGDAPVSVPFGPGAATAVVRFGGANRVATAVEVSRAAHESAATVVLARADAFADALSGAPLAVALDAPLLLTASNALPEETAAEIRRLGAARAVVLGGEAAIAPVVVQALDGELGLVVQRVGGADRYATSAVIAAELGGFAEAFVASGAAFPDALSASALAAAQRRPVLLVPGDGVPEAVAAQIAPTTDLVVVGGAAAVPEAVTAALDVRGGALRRLAGVTRFATSRAVADEALLRGLAPTVAWVATGYDFPDGLVAGAAAGAERAVLLLVDGDDPAGSAEAFAFLAEQGATLREVRIAGGPAAVSDEVEAALATAVAAR